MARFLKNSRVHIPLPFPGSPPPTANGKKSSTANICAQNPRLSVPAQTDRCDRRWDAVVLGAVQSVAVGPAGASRAHRGGTADVAAMPVAGAGAATPVRPNTQISDGSGLEPGPPSATHTRNVVLARAGDAATV